MKKYLAFDLGASSGRAILGGVADGKLVLREVHRFPNNGRRAGGALRWDISGLVAELKKGIVKACADGAPVSMGIDTWGVDYALFDRKSRERQIWIQDGNSLRPLTVKVGLNDGSSSEISSPEIKEGMTVVTGTEVQTAAKQLAAGGGENRSPFLPSPPRRQRSQNQRRAGR